MVGKREFVLSITKTTDLVDRNEKDKNSKEVAKRMNKVINKQVSNEQDDFDGALGDVGGLMEGIETHPEDTTAKIKALLEIEEAFRKGLISKEERDTDIARVKRIDVTRVVGRAEQLLIQQLEQKGLREQAEAIKVGDKANLKRLFEQLKRLAEQRKDGQLKNFVELAEEENKRRQEIFDAAGVERGGINVDQERERQRREREEDEEKRDEPDEEQLDRQAGELTERAIGGATGELEQESEQVAQASLQEAVNKGLSQPILRQILKKHGLSTSGLSKESMTQRIKDGGSAEAVRDLRRAIDIINSLPTGSFNIGQSKMNSEDDLAKFLSGDLTDFLTASGRQARDPEGEKKKDSSENRGFLDRLAGLLG